MALDDITTYPNQPAILEINRGNIGTIEDINSKAQIIIEIPEQSGSSTEPDYVYIS